MAVSQNNEVPNDLSSIKRKLAWRMGIAGLMIVCLLGGLAMFDYMSSRVESETAAVHYTEPVPVAKKTITQSVTPVEPVSEVREEKRKQRQKLARHRSTSLRQKWICRHAPRWLHSLRCRSRRRPLTRTGTEVPLQLAQSPSKHEPSRQRCGANA